MTDNKINTEIKDISKEDVESTKTKSVFAKIKQKINKKILFISLIVVLIVYKLFFTGEEEAKPVYTIGKVTVGDVISNLSVTGQVAMDSSIDVKSTVSGNINSIKVKPGDKVKTGDILATIDSKTALNTLKQAELSYNSANLAYKKSISKAATTTVISAQNTLESTKVAKEKAYSDMYNSILKTNLSMSSNLSSINTSIYGMDLEKNRYNINYYSDNIKAVEKNYNTNFGAELLYNNVVNQYNKTKKSYESFTKYYRELHKDSNSQDIYDINIKLIDTSKDFALSIKNMIDIIQTYHDVSNKYTYDINPQSNIILSDLKNMQNTVTQNIDLAVNLKNTVDNLKSSLVEQNYKLNDLENGVSGLDLESAKLSLDQSLLNYQIAQTNYSNYFIKSPIDGIVGSVNTSLGQDAGANSIATIVSSGKFINLSVYESDITKVSIGQKVTLKFDSVEDVDFYGTISQISLVGAVSSGVVSYNVKVAFEDPKDIIRSGMSVTGKIEVGSVKNVLRLPSNAIKYQGKKTYVQYFENKKYLVEVKDLKDINKKDNNKNKNKSEDRERTDNKDNLKDATEYNAIDTPINKDIEIGLVGNDFTEIKSGVIEGEDIVFKIKNNSLKSLMEESEKGNKSKK